jgi:hypothetical protein
MPVFSRTRGDDFLSLHVGHEDVEDFDAADDLATLVLRL